MPVFLISKIKPKNNGAFPMVEDVDLEGGFQVRDDVSDRDSIPTLNRKEGMLVYTVADDKTWRLGPGLGNGDWGEIVQAAIAGVDKPVLHIDQLDPLGVLPSTVWFLDPVLLSSNPVPGNTLTLFDGVVTETYTFVAGPPGPPTDISLGPDVIATMTTAAAVITAASAVWKATKVSDLTRYHANAAALGHAVIITRLGLGGAGSDRVFGSIALAAMPTVVDFAGAPDYAVETPVPMVPGDPGPAFFGYFEALPQNGTLRPVLSSPEVFQFQRVFPDSSSVWIPLGGGSGGVKVKREAFLGSAFAYGPPVSTKGLALTPDTTPDVLDLRSLWLNGVLLPDMVTSAPSAAGEWRIAGSTLEIFGDVTSDVDEEYVVRYPSL